MLASVGEIDQTLAMIAQAKERLREQGVPFDSGVEVGGMIEIPAAVLAIGVVPEAARLPVDRHQRPDPVHARGRPRRRRGGAPVRPAAPGGAEAARDGDRGRQQGGRADRGVRRDGRRGAADAAAARARPAQLLDAPGAPARVKQRVLTTEVARVEADRRADAPHRRSGAARRAARQAQRALRPAARVAHPACRNGIIATRVAVERFAPAAVSVGHHAMPSMTRDSSSALCCACALVAALRSRRGVGRRGRRSRRRRSRCRRAKGDAVALDKLRGKVVYVDFWASWCGAVPALVSVDERDAAEVRRQRLHRRRASTSTRSAPTPSASSRRCPAKFTVVFDEAGATPAAYGVKGMPSSYLIDARGKVVAVERGFLDEQQGARSRSASARCVARADDGSRHGDFAMRAFA